MKKALIAIFAIAMTATLAKGDSKLPPVGTKVVDPKTGIEYIIIETPSNIDGVTRTGLEKAPLVRGVTRRPLEPEATKRLHEGPVVVRSFFEASGKGEWADKGVASRGNYYYTINVKAESEVLEKKEDTDTGEILVVERRKFLESRDNLALSEIDFALALDTLPIDQVHDWIINAGTLAATIAANLGRIETAGAIGVGMAAVESWYQVAKKIDGVSVRGLLGMFGVEVPLTIDTWLSDLMSGKVKDAFDHMHACIGSIEGKSFRITYTQAASGRPLDIRYENEDGSPISEAEWETLRQANLFLDQDMVPDTRCEVGESWKVWADEIQGLFGLASTGRAEGQVTVTRGRDKGGDWTLELEETNISFRSDDGSTAGRMKLKEGNGLVDAKTASVKTLHATAEASLKAMNRTRHAMFFEFVKRLDGNSNLRFSLSSEPRGETEK